MITALIGLVILVRFTLESIATPLWQDEALIIFVANHNPWEIYFWQSLKSMTAGMPWPFLEYWAYLKVLQIILPFDHLMNHLEFYLRFPLLVYLSITAISAYVIVMRLSCSQFFASLCTISLFMTNTLTFVMGTELRFHTSGWTHSVFSWMLLTLTLTSHKEPLRRQQIYLWLWLAEAMIAGWSHIFSTYSLFTQLFIFTLACFGLIPRLKLPEISKKIKIAFFLTITGTGILQFLFFEKFMQHPSNRSTIRLLSSEAFQKSLIYMNDIFNPSFWLWLGAFLFFILLGFLKSPKSDKIMISIIALFGLSQLTLVLFLGGLHAAYNWTPFDLVSRYMTAGVAPFLFCYSYFSRYLFAPVEKWPHMEQRMLMSVFFAVNVLWLITHLVCKAGSRRPPTIFRNQLAIVHQRWRTVKNLVLEHKAVGKITRIAGAAPRHDHSVQLDINNGDLSHTWQLYTGGPFSIAPIQTYKTNAYGGRIGISCEESQLWPPASKDFPAETYLIDFCDPQKILLRKASPS